MHPIFFEFNTPEFLQRFLPSNITIYSYGFFIALGAVLGSAYVVYRSKKQFDTKFETIQTLIVLIILAAVVGGKLFIFFENPSLYINDPTILIKNFKNGFVFYGSLLFAIPTMLIFFRIHKLPVLPMLDIMAVTACIVHGFGRIGCFMAGCCYGTEHDGIFSVTFTNPSSVAEPLGVSLHPTQLYSSLTIFAILTILLFVKSRQQFNGQLFLLYLMLYAIARSILELYRGDLDRGFVIERVLSNSQFISAVLFLGALYFYIRLYKKTNLVS
jgi:phosphatidylglycerol---prolipoprotein diacylglyceryl transferase